MAGLAFNFPIAGTIKSQPPPPISGKRFALEIDPGSGKVRGRIDEKTEPLFDTGELSGDSTLIVARTASTLFTFTRIERESKKRIWGAALPYHSISGVGDPSSGVWEVEEDG